MGLASRTRGSEPGYSRPVLVVQSDDFNRSRISTVIVVAITSNTRLAAAPGNVLLPSKVSGLPKDSVANVSQLITLDKAFLTGRVGSLGEPENGRGRGRAESCARVYNLPSTLGNEEG